MFNAKVYKSILCFKIIYFQKTAAQVEDDVLNLLHAQIYNKDYRIGLQACIKIITGLVSSLKHFPARFYR